MHTKMVDFDYPRYLRLKEMYETTKDRILQFEGYEILRDYAKYLLQYLETKFKNITYARSK